MRKSDDFRPPPRLLPTAGPTPRRNRPPRAAASMAGLRAPRSRGSRADRSLVCSGVEGIFHPWVLAPGAVFVALIVIHERLLKAMERRRRAQRYFEKGMARLDGKWIGTGEPGDR